MKKITVGARGSRLSQAYVEKVKNLIVQTNDDIKDSDILIKAIKTSGDIKSNIKLSEIGGKKLFCKEIEEDLLVNNIDCAVHALKDMESEEHKDLVIAAFIKRNDPREALLSEKIKSLKELKDNLVIGSSSRRRELQIKKNYKNVSFINMRGNVDTRINKLSDQNLDGIILAAAGVKSLNLQNKISFIFEPEQMLPAVGQGIIAVQCRKNDDRMKEILKKINDKETYLCALAERTMLKTIGGNCQTAVGGLASINGNELSLLTELYSDNGDECFSYEIKGEGSNALNIGKIAGEKLLNLAGSKFKKK